MDLFAGPGRARIRDQHDTVEGSPLIALGHAEAPFSHVVLCDRDPENVAALEGRVGPNKERTTIVEGDCNEELGRIVSVIPKHGLNLALLDPFGPKDLRWKSIRALGSLKRMDLLIHFPTNGIKRNFYHHDFDKVVDGIVGTENWRETVYKARHVPRLIEHLREQLISLGYDSERVDSLDVLVPKNRLLYQLVFASKDKLGTEIWRSITRHDGPQRGFAFE